MWSACQTASGAAAVAVNQLVAVSKRRLSFLCQRHHGGVEPGEYRVSRTVGGRRPTPLLCHLDGATVDGGSRRARPLQPQALDQRNESGR